MSTLDELRAENESLKKAKTGTQSERKGGVSVYGVGRFPIALYKEHWKTILDKAHEIRAFLKENEATLKSKD